MADDDRTQDSGAPGHEGNDANVTTLDALQVDGKGQEGLEDATEGDLPDTSEAQGDDVAGHANVQSSGRATFEQMVAGSPNEGPATPSGDNIQQDVAPPSEPDNNVDARFENPHPDNAPVADTQSFERDGPPPAPVAIERPQEQFEEPRPDPEPEGEDTLNTDEAGQTTAAAPIVTAPPPPPEPELPAPEIPPVAQTPTLKISLSDSPEDTNGAVGTDRKMKLNIEANTNNADGGTESLTISIKGVPDGFTFSDVDGNAMGTKAADGSWSFEWGSDVPDLYLVRPLHYSGDLSFEVSAIARESNGSTASVVQTLPLHVEAIADQPILAVEHVAGMENTGIAIGDHIHAQLVDADGSETLTVYITPKPGSATESAMPAGTTLNHGTLLAADLTLEDGTVIKAGSWAVDPADLADLKVFPPTAVSDDFTFEVRSVTTEAMNGDVAVNGPMDLRVDVGIVDPSVAGQGVGNEDTWIALDLSANINAADGTETLTVWLEDLPSGAELRYADSHNVLIPTGGRYDVTNDLQNLEVHWTTTHKDDDISFKLRAVAQDVDALNPNDTPDRDTPITDTVAPDTNEVVADVTVVVKAVADQPPLTAQAIGVEDKYAALTINTALVDSDGSETLSIYVEPDVGAPAGMVVRVFDTATGTLTDATRVDADITLSDGSVVHAGSYVLTPAQAAQNVRIYGLDHDSNADFKVNVVSVATEAASDAQTAVRNAVHSVNVDVAIYGDADVPATVVVDQNQVIAEQQFYDLRTLVDPQTHATTGVLADVDGSETLIEYRIRPQDADSRMVIGDGTSTPVGLENGSVSNGTIQALPPEGYWTVSAADLLAGKVWVGGPNDWGSVTTERKFDIQVRTIEDDAAQTPSLTDGLTRQGDAWSDWDTLSLRITPVADTPSAVTANAIGVEDKYASITMSASLNDSDNSESLSYYVQPGVNAPAGMVVKVFDAATNTLTDAVRVDADITLTDGTVVHAGSYAVTAAQAAQNVRVYGLDANSDGDFHVSVTAVAADGTTTAGSSVDVAVTVFGDADIPTTAVVDDRQVINEDATYNLHTAIGDGQFAVEAGPTDPTAETIIQYHVKPLEAGSRLFINGVEQSLPGADGYWTLNAADVTAGKVTVAGPANWGDWNLDKHFDIRSVTQETDHAADTSGLFDGLSRAPTALSAWDTLTLGIDPVADAPILSVTKAVGVEDKYAVLDISSSLADTDGSETLTIYIKDLPDGTTLNHGTLLDHAVTLQNGTIIPVGGYQLTAADLPGLQIQNLSHDSDYGAGDFQISVLAVSRDQANDTYPTGQEAVTTLTPTVTIFGDADKPASPVVEAVQTINEDSFYDLRTLLGDGTRAVDGVLGDVTRESLDTFHIKPIEAGSRLAISSDATIGTAELQALPAEGYWTVSAADLFAGKVYVGGAANWGSLTDQLHFDVQVRTIEADNAANTSSLAGTGLSRSATAWSDWDRLTLQVTPVADATTVGASNTGNEDTAIAVTPTFTLVDTDGSEHLTGDVIFLSSDADMISGTLKVGTATITPVDVGGGVYQWTIPGANVGAKNGSATEFQLNNVTFTPSTHNAGNITYTIKVTTEDSDDGITHVTTATGCAINVTAVADQPTIGVGAADMSKVVHLVEDSRLSLGLDTDLVDVLNSNVGAGYNPDPESFSYIALEQIPTGWTVWKDNGDGSFTQISVSGGKATLTNEYANLDKIMLRPPTNLDLAATSSYSFRFKSTSAESENSSKASNTFDFKVTIDAVADTPTLQVTHVRVNEDVRVALDIRPALTDTDGSESITDVFVSGAPAGTTFYSAAANGVAVGTLGNMVDGAFVADPVNGTVWRFTTADLSHLYLQPKHDSNVDFDLSVVARSTEAANGSHADSIAQTLKVIVKGISDGPFVPAEHLNGNTLIATGIEDQLIDPGFGSYRPADVDGSETLSVVIKEIPADVTMSMTAGNEKFAKYLGTDAHGNQQWSIDPNHLGDVRFAAPHDFAGDFTVKLDLITTEDDGHSSVSSRDLVVTVTQDADAPGVSVSASVNEDAFVAATGIPVSFDISPGETVAGGIEQVSHVDVQFNFSDLGLPSGTVLTLVIDGHEQTLTSGQWIDISGSYGTQMYVKGVPEDWSSDIPLKVRATSSEYDANGAIVDSETRIVDGSVHIQAVADEPETFTLDGGGGGDLPDIAAFDHDISNVVLYLKEPDGDIIKVKVEDFPTDAEGVRDANLLDVDTFVGQHYAGDEIIAIAVKAGSNAVNGYGEGPLTLVDTSIDPATLPIDVGVSSGSTYSFATAFPDGPLTTPNNIGSGDGGLTTTVNTPVDLGLSLTLGDHDGSEPASMYFIVEGVPNGVLLNHGYNSGDGYWIVPYSAGSTGWSLTASSSYTGSATLTVHPVITDYDPDGGSDTLYATAKTVTLTITDQGGQTGTNPWPTGTSAIAPPSLLGTPKDGIEDVNFNLDNISASAAANTTVSAIVVTGVQAGASVSGGYYNPFNHTWTVAPADAGNLVINPPDDYAGQVTATLRAVAMNATGAYAYSPTASMVVANLIPDTDGANVSVTSMLGTSSIEDVAAIPITLAFQERDNDFSEMLVGGTVAIDLPADAQLYLNGVLQSGTNGHYTLALADFDASGHSGLTGLSVVPPAHFHGTLPIQVSVEVKDGSDTIVVSTGSLNVNLAAEADVPTITAANVTGNEDSLIAFDVTIAAPDVTGPLLSNPSQTGGSTYASEYLSVVISGVPADGVVMGALKNGDGTWTVKDANVLLTQVDGAWVAKLTNVKLLPPQDDSGAYTLTVNAYTIEPGNRDVASSSASFTVTVAGVADVPTIDPVAVNNGSEDVPLAIDLNAQLIDLSETMSVTITGVPAGASFTDADGVAVGASPAAGTWVLQNGDLFNADGSAKPLYFLGKLHEAGTWTMTAQATSMDGATTATSNSRSFAVTLSGVADTPTLSLTDLTPVADGYLASGNEGSDIAIRISATTPDAAGETVEVLINGAPVGSKFINGGTTITVSGDGYWHIPSSLLNNNLKIRPPTDYNGDITLSVQSHTTEGATNGYSDIQTLVVQVAAVNDAPDAVLFGATGQSEVGAITSPIFVIPEGQANYIDINDNADGNAVPDLAKMEISIDNWNGSATAPDGNTDEISLAGLSPRLDTSGNLVVDFNGQTFGLSYNQGTHTLTFTGSADANTYEALAEKAILISTDGSLEPGIRTLGITVYDAANASDKVTTTATIGDVAQQTGVALTGDALGTVHWGADGAVLLLGGAGDDTIMVAGGNGITINGGAGNDMLLMQPGDYGQTDWLFVTDANNDIHATSASHPDDGFVVHLTQGSAVVDDTTHEVVFDNATGTITFDDNQQQVAFSQIERMSGH